MDEIGKKKIKQDKAVQSSMRSRFLQDEMVLEILFQASFNEQDWDF